MGKFNFNAFCHSMEDKMTWDIPTESPRRSGALALPKFIEKSIKKSPPQNLQRKRKLVTRRPNVDKTLDMEAKFSQLQYEVRELKKQQSMKTESSPTNRTDHSTTKTSAVQDLEAEALRLAAALRPMLSNRVSTGHEHQSSDALIRQVPVAPVIAPRVETPPTEEPVSHKDCNLKVVNILKNIAAQHMYLD